MITVYFVRNGSKIPVEVDTGAPYGGGQVLFKD